MDSECPTFFLARRFSVPPLSTIQKFSKIFFPFFQLLWRFMFTQCGLDSECLSFFWPVILNYKYILTLGHNDCNQCGKTFQGKNAKRDLKNHMKTHSAPLAPLVPKEISK